MSQDGMWRDRAPEFLAEVADVCANTLVEVAGMAREQADYLGYCVMRAIAEHAGGQMVYVPKADAIERCERDQAIWHEFTGQNHQELARKYGITKMHVYRVLRRMRVVEAERRHRALDL